MYNKNMDENTYIGVEKASQILQVSSYAIRRFCDSGYIPHIKRNRQYQRVLSPAQFELLAMLVQMQQFGFSKSEIKRYAKLARQGQASATERLAILTTRKHQLQSEIKSRQAAIDFIERQEEISARVQAAMPPNPDESRES